MSKYRRFRWAPFYLLIPLAGALLYFDGEVMMDDTLRMVMLGAIAALIGILAVRWIERHPTLAEGEGAGSLHGRYVLAGMPLDSGQTGDDSDCEGDDVQFAPVRHSRAED